MLKDFEQKEIGILERQLKREKGFRFGLFFILGVLCIALMFASQEVTVELRSLDGEKVQDVIKENSASASYLTKTTKEVIDNGFIFTPLTVNDKFDTLLKMVAPENYGTFEKFIVGQKEKIRRNNVSSVFFPKEFQTNHQKQSVVVTGILRTYSGDRPVLDEVRTYRFDFKVRNFTIYLDAYNNLTGVGQPFEVELGTTPKENK